MGHAQLIEGTTEEILTRLQADFPSQKLRVFVEMEEEDLGSHLPAPPNTVRDGAHLVELLREGLTGPRREATDETWEQMRQEVHRRHAERQP